MAQQARRRRKRRPNYSSPQGHGQGAPEPARPADAPPKRRRPGARERPPAPWGSFPLVELVVLCGIAIVVVGFFMEGTRGGTLIVVGIALASLAGLEVSIREHFAGYKSHSTVLAATPAVILVGLGLYLLPSGLQRGVGLVVAALAFAIGFYLLREAFKRRSGGIGFKA